MDRLRSEGWPLKTPSFPRLEQGYPGKATASIQTTGGEQLRGEPTKPGLVRDSLHEEVAGSRRKEERREEERREEKRGKARQGKARQGKAR
jgi:hypothetical protein